jgi:hypothetical protein
MIIVITQTIFILLRHGQFHDMYAPLLLDHYEGQIRLIYACIKRPLKVTEMYSETVS